MQMLGVTKGRHRGGEFIGATLATYRVILMEIYNERRFKIYVAKGDTARKLRLMGRF